GGGPCIVDCTLTVDSGTSLTLTPTPDEGHVFMGWTGDCTGRSACSISVVETANIGAVFSPLPESLETLRLTVGVDMAGAAVLTSTACADVYPDLPDGLSINSDGLIEGTPERSTAFRRYAVLSWEGDCGVAPLDAFVTSFDLAVNTAVAPDVAPLAVTSVANLSPVEALNAMSDLLPNSAATAVYPPGTFEPYEWVVLFAYSEPVVLGSALSTIDGAMTADIVLTEAVGAGDHNLVAIGTVSERAVRTPFSVAERSAFTQLSSPQRIMDTRSGSRVGELDGSGVVRELQVTGVGGVPSSGVSGVALNVTVVDGAANEFGGFVTVFPCGVRPDVSSVNFVSGDTVANGVIAPVSSDGRVCFYVYGTAHLIADINGYFPG
ncbi:MAG: InlB B-repeat-containing protein, partial [Ilumatobacteraceae bacterium]